MQNLISVNNIIDSGCKIYLPSMLIEHDEKNTFINLLVICGHSGSGKTYAESLLTKKFPNYFNKLPQVTTRPKRNNEEYGREYFFIDKNVFFTFGFDLQNRLIGKTEIKILKQVI